MGQVPMRSSRPLGFALLLLTALVPNTAMAHGADVVASVTRTVEVELSVVIEATYHSGRPMEGAQVTIFAPGSPAEPWRVGACDEAGRFEFAPPADRPGVWDVRVTHHGHGGRVAVEVAADSEGGSSPVVRAQASSTAHLTPLQKSVMAACVIWGLVGTALFFSRRRG